MSLKKGSGFILLHYVFLLHDVTSLARCLGNEITELLV